MSNDKARVDCMLAELDGFDPRNTVKRYERDEFYFTVEKDREVEDTKNGLPKYVEDWIEHYITTT